MDNNIVNEILRTKKYSGLDCAVIERICSQITPRYTKQKDAIKAVKKELHIIYGAFLSSECHTRAKAMLEGYSEKNMYNDKAFSERLMGLHVSTAERVASAENFYRFAGACIKPDDTLLDIGCGFNPFSLPFLDNKPKAYIAYDICSYTIKLINIYFAPLGPAFRASLFDAAAHASYHLPSGNDCIVFMFKLFPLLEQQIKGCAFELLSTMDYRIALISFPTKTSSGREKGMEAYYTDMFSRGLPSGLVIVEKVVFDNEMIFKVIKHRMDVNIL